MQLRFEEDLNIVTIGDIHGEFNKITFKINSQYNIRNSICIFCGDCGFGFHKPNYYNNVLKKINAILKKNNNHYIFLRGNHDNPSYFNDEIKYTNIKLVSDYSTIKTPTKLCLLIGGGISIDRIIRNVNIDYWIDEKFIYDEEKLIDLFQNNELDKVTHVFTHSNPDFCYPITNENIMSWLKSDITLLSDINIERENHSKIYEYLIKNNHNIKEWLCGHYHESKFEYINNTKFRILDVDEVYNVN